MNTEDILKAIDGQIAQLQQARVLLAGDTTAKAVTPLRGRPKGSKNKTAPVKAAKRVMSAEAKARIAAAQKLRWATQKEATETPLKSAAKRSVPARAKKAAATPKAAKKTAAKKTAAEA